MKKIISLTLFCVTVSLCYRVTAIHAQSTTLSINPPVVEILLAPNKQVKQTFTLQVEGEDVSIIPTLHRIKPVGNGGHSQIDLEPLTPSSIPLTITSSAALNQPFTINHEPFTITLTLAAASLDVATDFYLALVIRTVPNTPYAIPDTAYSVPGISALILTTINPTGVTPIGLEIQNFDLPLIHDTWFDFTLNPELKNSVDQMIRPEGQYEIISPSGKTIFSRDLYPNLILGNSSRALQSSINHQPSTITWTPHWSNIGPHRVRLLVTTQGGTKLTEVERTIWFLPLRFMVILTAIVLMIIAFYVRKFRKPKLPIDTLPRTH